MEYVYFPGTKPPEVSPRGLVIEVEKIRKVEVFGHLD
jgi:hypothetical protein